jgi:DNA repair ATPase RecN
MSITVIAEVWRALKFEIDGSNLPDAAETLVNVLIENDFDPADIKEAFRRETEVMQALRDYNSQFEEEEEYEEYEEDEDTEDDEW